jgi:predicted ATPase
VDGGVSALLLEGEAGIGKSTLWAGSVEHMRASGLRVLSSQPSEADRDLSYVGLVDLFADVLADVLPDLSVPQRRALEVALLLEDGSASALDLRALATAVRSALQLLARDQPLVVAIDDLQWFDPSSRHALAFALRRLSEESVVILLAQRSADAEYTTEVMQAIGVARLERLQVVPLSIGALHRLLQARLGRTFARPTLVRLERASGGNPFYALELARVLEAEHAAGDPTRPLPVPEGLERLVRGRLGDLPEATREALTLTSALGRPSPSLLQAAGVSESALEPAFTAHVLEQHEGVIRFTHPLLASVLYQGLTGAERRDAHRLLAEIVVDP